MSDLHDAIEDLGTDDFLVPHDLDDRYGSWLEVTEAARLVAGAQRIVNEQAEDDGLWFVAVTAPEAYLQEELRRLHAAIEESTE